MSKLNIKDEQAVAMEGEETKGLSQDGEGAAEPVPGEDGGGNAEDSGSGCAAGDGAADAGADPKRGRRAKAICAVLAAVALVAALGVVAALASQPPSESVVEPDPGRGAGEPDPGGAKVALTVEADVSGELAGKMVCSVVDADGAEVVGAREIEIGARTDLGEFEGGEYAVKVEAYPVLEDGSTFRLADGVDLGFEVGDADVAIELKLAHVPVEDMGDEEREAAAAALESANGGAPAGDRAPSGGGGPSAEGRSSGSQPAHQHDWQPVTAWVPDIVTVVDEEGYSYDEPVYGDKCNYCGFTSEQGDVVAHLMQYDTSDPSHAIASVGNDVVIRYNHVNVPAVTHTEDRGSYQPTGAYSCSCGAAK